MRGTLHTRAHERRVGLRTPGRSSYVLTCSGNTTQVGQKDVARWPPRREGTSDPLRPPLPTRAASSPFLAVPLGAGTGRTPPPLPPFGPLPPVPAPRPPSSPVPAPQPPHPQYPAPQLRVRPGGLLVVQPGSAGRARGERGLRGASAPCRRGRALAGRPLGWQGGREKGLVAPALEAPAGPRWDADHVSGGGEGGGRAGRAPSIFTQRVLQLGVSGGPPALPPPPPRRGVSPPPTRQQWGCLSRLALAAAAPW